MKTLTDHLAQYADYHRDRRNIASHFVGIPMILLAVTILLSRPALFDLPGLDVAVTPAWIAALASIVFYLRLDLRYGVTMAAVLALCVWLSQWIAGYSTAVWLGWGIGLFVVGWAIQFVGHAWEGRKPAFVDDLVGLLVGPLFVVVEAGFALGLRTEVLHEIERRVGPTRSGHAATPTA
jgi:uncharacterized membrane protein YGL010W